MTLCPAQVTMWKHLGILAVTTLVALARLASAQNDGSQQTYLDEYVFSEESLSQYSYFHASDYDYEATNPITGVSYQAYVINMTSGEWRTGRKFRSRDISRFMDFLHV